MNKTNLTKRRNKHDLNERPPPQLPAPGVSYEQLSYLSMTVG